MKCHHCGKEGAIGSAGKAFHPNCFIAALGFNLGQDMGNLEDLLKQKQAAEEQQRQFDEQQEKEAQERLRRAQEQQWQNQQRAYGFNDFFSGNWSRGRQQQQAPPKADPNYGKSTVVVGIDEKRLKQLLMLCHPDKHGNSERATEVTRWLIELKEKLDRKKATA